MNVGKINNVTLDDSSNILSGGTITVDGITFIVPSNSMLVTPQQNVLWSELWVDGVVQMPLWPETQWEAAVYANEVNGSLITGLVFIQQASARIITGFISSIDHETGNFQIAGSSSDPTSGITARINDPVGRFGLPYEDNPLWAADTENPSITSISAMPLCIQRPFGNLTDDPLCPTKNRPKRADGTAHTMITFLPEAQRTESDPDPNFFVPLAVGDYVTVLGTFVEGNLLTIFNLIANIGIFTPAGELPVYMYVDRNQFAIQGPAAAETGETRAVAFTTDVTQSLTWFRVDVEPCSSATTWFPLLTEAPLLNLAGQQPGKTVFRGGVTDEDPAPIFTGFKLQSGQTKVTNNSIVSGVYLSPINGFANGYIFAEVTTYGDIMFPLEFQDMPFLAQGSGPYQEGVPLKEPMSNPPIIGQLDPWPGTTVPAPADCSNVNAPFSPSPFGNGTTNGTDVERRSAEVDTVTVLSATFARTRGETAYTVAAQDSVTTGTQAVLTLSGAQVQNNVTGIIMTSLGDGMYSTTFSVKNQLTSITIVSNLGGVTTFTF